MAERSTLETLAGRPLEDALRGWIDNRIGNALFLGARFPDLAATLLERGISVMLVETDLDAVARFRDDVKARGDARRLNVDPRPYAGIQFEASSYNLVLAWDGLPAGLTLAEFGKKLRRELKAGSSLFLRIPIRPRLSARPGLLDREPLRRLRPLAGRLEPLTARVRPAAIRAGQKLRALLSTEDATDLDVLRQDLSRFLKIEEEVFEGPILSRVARALPSVAARPVPGDGLATQLGALDRRLAGEAWSGRVLIRASKTLDMGHVFLTGSQFDPRYRTDD